jgi:hypothetical protein
MSIYLELRWFTQEINSGLKQNRNVVTRAETSCKLLKQLNLKYPIGSEYKNGESTIPVPPVAYVSKLLVCRYKFEIL